jgi:hypothetical protein
VQEYRKNSKLLKTGALTEAYQTMATMKQQISRDSINESRSGKGKESFLTVNKLQ